MTDFTRSFISELTEADHKLVEDALDLQISMLHQCEGRLLRYRKGEENVIQTLNQIYDTRGFLAKVGMS